MRINWLFHIAFAVMVTAYFANVMCSSENEEEESQQLMRDKRRRGGGGGWGRMDKKPILISIIY